MNPMRRWATVASVVWLPASSIRWPRSDCHPGVTGCVTSTACLHSRSSTDNRSKNPKPGCRTDRPGSSRAPTSTTPFASAAPANIMENGPNGMRLTRSRRRPSTTSSRGTGPIESAPCACGKRRRHRKSTSVPSTPVTTNAQRSSRTDSRTFPGCSTRMTAPRLVASCACARSIFSFLHPCRTSWNVIRRSMAPSATSPSTWRSTSMTPTRRSASQS